MNRYERWLAEHPEVAKKPEPEPDREKKYVYLNHWETVDPVPPPERRHATGTSDQFIIGAGRAAFTSEQQVALRQSAASRYAEVLEQRNRVVAMREALQGAGNGNRNAFTQMLETHRQQSLRSMQRSLSRQMYYPDPVEEDE